MKTKKWDICRSKHITNTSHSGRACVKVQRIGKGAYDIKTCNANSLIYFDTVNLHYFMRPKKASAVGGEWYRKYTFGSWKVMRPYFTWVKGVGKIQLLFPAHLPRKGYSHGFSFLLWTPRCMVSNKVGVKLIQWVGMLLIPQFWSHIHYLYRKPAEFKVSESSLCCRNTICGW